LELNISPSFRQGEKNVENEKPPPFGSGSNVTSTFVIYPYMTALPNISRPWDKWGMDNSSDRNFWDHSLPDHIFWDRSF